MSRAINNNTRLRIESNVLSRMWIQIRIRIRTRLGFLLALNWRRRARLKQLIIVCHKHTISTRSEERPGKFEWK